MNLSQLRAFHLVAAADSFTLAARTAGLSQPTLSSQVRSLEQTYGVNLFNRKGRGARLTPIGQSLLHFSTRPWMSGQIAFQPSGSDGRSVPPEGSAVACEP